MNDPLTVIPSDALSALRQMTDESVQCVVTSPPYWSLRDYGIGPIVWDGDPNCQHDWTETKAKEGYTGTTRWQHTTNGRGEDQPDEKRLRTTTTRETRPEAWGEVRQGSFCSICGAWLGCLGLEPTPELYVQHIVQIFREVKRVLKKDGTLWLNLGDSYCGSFGAQSRGDNGVPLSAKQSSGRPVNTWPDGRPPNARIEGMKPKDLVGIPWMVAFALRADGWYLRSDIIWSKPNPMPESVTDRPTKSHEYIFLLSKSERYYYDAEAIKELAETEPHAAGYVNGEVYAIGPMDRGGHSQREGDQSRVWAGGGMRNRRSVWTVTTQPFSGAHFATFPPDLIKPCILAGAPVGGVVLDPFAGSGTTGKVAIELGRKAILIEPKAEYIEMIKKRCQTTIGLPL